MCRDKVKQPEHTLERRERYFYYLWFEAVVVSKVHPFQACKCIGTENTASKAQILACTLD